MWGRGFARQWRRLRRSLLGEFDCENGFNAEGVALGGGGWRRWLFIVREMRFSVWSLEGYDRPCWGFSVSTQID